MRGSGQETFAKSLPYIFQVISYPVFVHSQCLSWLNCLACSVKVDTDLCLDGIEDEGHRLKVNFLNYVRGSVRNSCSSSKP